MFIVKQLDQPIMLRWIDVLLCTLPFCMASTHTGSVSLHIDNNPIYECSSTDMAMTCRAVGFVASRVHYIQIKKSDEEKAAAGIFRIMKGSKGHQVIPVDQSVKAEGDLGTELTENSFLKVTFTDSAVTRSGEYVCYVFYFDENDVLQTSAANAVLNVKDIGSAVEELREECSEIQKDQEKILTELQNQVASDVPQKVQVKAVSSTSLLVSWEQPEKPNKVITGYTLYYTTTPKRSVLDWSRMDTEDINTHSAILTCLEPNTSYAVKVHVSYATGQGAWSFSVYASPTPEAQTKDCNEEGWTYHEARCYKFFEEQENWADAQEICKRKGTNGRLVEIGSNATNTIIKDFAASGTEITKDSWIGLNDIDQEGTFVWQSGNKCSYRNWGEKEPNDKYGKEDCVHLRPIGDWNDLNCNSTISYVCQFDINQNA